MRRKRITKGSPMRCDWTCGASGCLQTWRRSAASPRTRQGPQFISQKVPQPRRVDANQPGFQEMSRAVPSVPVKNVAMSPPPMRAASAAVENHLITIVFLLPTGAWRRAAVPQNGRITASARSEWACAIGRRPMRIPAMTTDRHESG